MNGALEWRKPSHFDEWEFELPVSMIDVVFLLLVFFLCSTQFRTRDWVLESRLPREGGSTEPSPVYPPAELRVKIFWEDPSGEAVRDPVPGARVVMLVGPRRCADPNELARVLALVTERHAGMSVVIDARSRVPFRWVLGAVDACARANIENVRFTAPASAEGGSEWWQL